MNRKSVWAKLLLIIGISMVAVCGCEAKSSNGRQITKNYQEKNFNSISLEGACDVELSEGNFSVQAIGDESTIEDIKVRVRGKCLELTTKSKINFNWFNKSGKEHKKVIIKVSAPDINKLELVGSGDIKVVSSLHPKGNFSVSVVGSGDVKFYKDLILTPQNTLKLEITGSGDIEIKGKSAAGNASISVCSSGDIKLNNLQVNQLSAEVAGSGDLDISGSGNKAKFSVLGSGDIDAYKFPVKLVQASVVGSGDIKCNTQESLTFSTIGSGNVYYKGNPKQVKNNGPGKAKAK